jgi:hypothetical protein
MSCPACKTHSLVQIDMKVSGEELTFSCCSSCDLRWWAGEQGVLALPSVLERVAAR